jgi:hypothetical protein
MQLISVALGDLSLRFKSGGTLAKFEYRKIAAHARDLPVEDRKPN